MIVIANDNGGGSRSGSGGENSMEFTQSTIADRQLILEMLKFEDQLYLSPQGQDILKQFGKNTTSLEGSKTIQRMTLNHFGYQSNDDSLSAYRRIFHHYYQSSTDYDKEILSSVYYMRENRLLYYTSPEIKIGDQIPNTTLYTTTPESTPIDLHTLVKKHNIKIIASFSLS